MKYLVVSGGAFLALLVFAIYLNSSLNYFSSTFESSDYWLLPNNTNLSGVNSFESFTTQVELFDFPRDSSTFAVVSYRDEFLNYQDISIPWNLVGKTVYSINKDKQTKLLTSAEAIKAVSEWRTEYTFDLSRLNLASDKYNILRVYIHEPI